VLDLNKKRFRLFVPDLNGIVEVKKTEDMKKISYLFENIKFEFIPPKKKQR
jgi:hypothetical protein